MGRLVDKEADVEFFSEKVDCHRNALQGILNLKGFLHFQQDRV